MKRQNLIHILLGIVCIGLLPDAQAVLPPPDGGYPGGNTAEGQAALLSLTTGGFNTAVGYLSLRSNTNNSFNTAIGAGTLFANTGSSNTATGAGALLSNTTGIQNAAAGAFALFSNTDGLSNTANGHQALFSNTTGDGNTATGTFALFSNTTGFQNAAYGVRSFENNTEGSRNTAIGYLALSSNTTGDGNIALGFNAGSNVTTANNVICIGTEVVGANTSDRCFIGNIYSNLQPIVGTNPDYVTITMGGRLGRGGVSSRRYKHDIKPMDKGSEVLFALKPVSFRYQKQYDATQTPAFGLIAEDVAEIAPDLVGRNRQGQPESVRYEQINAMLLNEFLKEHRTVQEQGAIIAKQQRQIKALTDQLEELGAQIQKVSAQIEIRQAVGQTALNNP